MRALGERCAVGVENPDLRDWVRLLAPPQVKVASAAARAWVGGVGECGGEEAVGPLFGVAAGVGEDEVDFGVADLEPGELVGEPVAVDVLQLVEGRVSGLDDEGGERELGESLQLEADRSVGERGREVVEALALDRGEDRPVWAADRVVAGGNGCPDRFYRLLSEAVGVALAGIDGDRDRLGEGASAGDPAARVGGAGGLLGLPEDRLAPLDLREDELGAGTLGGGRARGRSPPRADGRAAPASARRSRPPAAMAARSGDSRRARSQATTRAPSAPARRRAAAAADRAACCLLAGYARRRTQALDPGRSCG